MPEEKKGHPNFQLEITTKFDGLKKDQKTPATSVYAYDTRGGFLGSASLDPKSTKLAVQGAGPGTVVRLVFAPQPRSKEAQPQYSQLVKSAHFERQVRLDPATTKIEISLPNQVWHNFELLCECLINGTVVKQVTMPDGTTQDLPVCHSRVNICEVETLIDLIEDLFDDEIIFQLRDELLNVINPVIPIPVERVPPFPPPGPGPLETFRFENVAATTTSVSAIAPPREIHAPAFTRKARVARLRAMSATMRKPALQRPAAAPATIDLSNLDQESRAKVHALSLTQSARELRVQLKNFIPVIFPYLCYWDFLEPWWWLFVNCVQRVDVGPDGSFEAIIFYDCDDELPGLYFSVDQLQNGIWRTVYQPPVGCNTYWNYRCGDQITIYVTDPRAVPCTPDNPINVPPGVNTFVIPWSVGSTKIWGLGQIAPPPMGWVKQDGRTDYNGGAGPFLDSPFGSSLGFWLRYSPDLPTAGIAYYKFSYSPQGLEDWHDIAAAVYAPFGHVVPQPFPNPPHVTFRNYRLGPFTVGASTNLFQFRPHASPALDPMDPIGSYTYWDDPPWGGHYAAYLDSTALATGTYDIKLEVLDGSGNIVMPLVAPSVVGDFFFLLPISDSDTRGAVAGDMDFAGNGLRFKVHVDNNRCTASIDAPAIGLNNVTDDCGFLRYNPSDSVRVTLAFHANHPNNEGRFNFGMIRGIKDVPAADAGYAEVSTTPVHNYIGDGNGNFTHNFVRSDLLCDLSGCCVNAAFAESLYVYAKATDGVVRLWGYDASALRAFALATL